MPKTIKVRWRSPSTHAVYTRSLMPLTLTHDENTGECFLVALDMDVTGCPQITTPLSSILTNMDHLESSQAWYASRLERLRQLIHEEAPLLEDAFCCIVANGTASANEPPTYAQMLARAAYATEQAHKLLHQATIEIQNLKYQLEKKGLPS